MKGTTWEDWDSELKSSPEVLPQPAGTLVRDRHDHAMRAAQAREAFELNKQAALGAEIRALNNTANMLASGVGVERVRVRNDFRQAHGHRLRAHLCF